MAGLGITALLIAGECKSGEPSGVGKLGRVAAGKLGLDTPPAELPAPANRQ